MRTSLAAKLSTITRQHIDPNFILIYTTANRAKPSYRQGILDALCYPNGHIIPYSYRRHHLEPDLLEKSRLSGRQAVIIFVDLDANRNVTYFPLRRVTINNIAFEAGTRQPPMPQERVTLSLSLEDFVEYKVSEGKDQWNERVRKFDDRRRIVSDKPAYFVIAGSDHFPRSGNSVAAAWESLVTTVAESAELRSAVFVRLDHMKPYDPGLKMSQSQIKGDRFIYRLLPGNIYSLNLCVFERIESNAGASAETKLKVLTSAKDALEAVQPFQSIVSGLVEKTTLIACKRTVEDIIATVTIFVDRGADLSAVVNSPNPTLFVRISVSWRTLVGFVACVVLGGFLVSIDKEFVKELAFTGCPAFWALGGKTVGAFLLATAAYLAFRKLPSASQ